MASSPNLALPFIAQGQAQKEVTHNEALRILDTLVQLAVLDKDLNAPPGSPQEGERWIVGASPTGAWSGHASYIAAWQDGAWQFSAPVTGCIAFVIDEAMLYFWNGAEWASLQNAITVLQNLAMLGIRTTADATNRLAVKSDGVLLNHDDVTPGTGHIRVAINKSAAVNDAGFTFQDGFSTRTLLGLLGDDDFTIKVSPDGSRFYLAISIDKDTGHVGLGGAVADANNGLIVKGTAFLFDRETDDVRFTFNKATPGDDVALTFQTNYSARALIGLLGDDNFTFKVTPDGSTFYTGIVIDKATGKVSFPALAKVSAHLNYDHYAATTYVNTDINNEDLDTANTFASNVFTAPTTGLYKVGYTLGWTQNGTNAPASMHGRLLKNGATEVLPSASQSSSNAANTGKIVICTEGIIPLTAGDTLRLQHKFSSLDGYASANITRFWVEQLT